MFTRKHHVFEWSCLLATQIIDKKYIQIFCTYQARSIWEGEGGTHFFLGGYRKLDYHGDAPPPPPDFLGAYKLHVKNWSENREIISEIKDIVGKRTPSRAHRILKHEYIVVHAANSNTFHFELAPPITENSISNCLL